MKRISGEKIYENLWECRNLEIEHYWHRMVFMTAFVLLSFAGYGGAFLAFVSRDGSRLPFSVSNGILFYLAIVGFVISTLWLMMSKGSKAWYEEYENAIEAFQRYRCKRKFSQEIKRYATLDYWRFRDKIGLDLNDWLWSTKAGSYSVSRVGIAIGHIAALIWIALASLHWYVGVHASGLRDACELLRFNLCNPRCMGFLGIMIVLFFWVYARSFLKSSYMQRYNR